MLSAGFQLIDPGSSIFGATICRYMAVSGMPLRTFLVWIYVRSPGALFWVPVHPFATAFIFLCTLAFSMGCYFFIGSRPLRKTGKRETAALVYGNPFLKGVFYVATFHR